MKYRTILFLIQILLIFGCASNNQIYLNSARPCNDNTYGCTPQNPVVFNKCKLDNKKTIIEDYISRLAAPNGNRLEILDKKQIPNPMSNNLKEKYLEEYTLKYQDSLIPYRLYFNVNKSRRKLYIPEGFLFGYLTGK
jgi:hypothetical protein